MNNRNDSELKLNAAAAGNFERRDFPSPEEIEFYIMEARRQRRDLFVDLVVRGSKALARWIRYGTAKLFPSRAVADDGEAAHPAA
jgi:hypothetical protein